MRYLIILLALIITTHCNQPLSRKELVAKVLNEIKNNKQSSYLKERNSNYKEFKNEEQYENEFNYCKVLLNTFGIPETNKFKIDSTTMTDFPIVVVTLVDGKSKNDTLKSAVIKFVFSKYYDMNDFQFWFLECRIKNDSIDSLIQANLDSIVVPDSR